MTDRVTLITGASARIGTELARVFASNGHRVALVARRAERLAALAGEITASGGGAPIVIACDLEQPDAGDKIAAALAAEGAEVEFVVNNAGFGLFGKAVELDRAEQLAIIAVNILAMTDLSLRFSDSLTRHRGGILNLGSLAGFLPGPGMAVYYASKAHVLSFSEALRQELAPRGVRESLSFYRRVVGGLRQASRTLRYPRRVIRLGHPAVQHHDLDGAANAQCAPVLCPVRAGGHLGAHPRQDRSIKARRELGRGKH